MFLKIFKNSKKFSDFDSDFDFKGIDIGDDRVKNWLVSLAISTLFGFFITLPAQVIRKICF
jgi:hypothetical protein